MRTVLAVRAHDRVKNGCTKPYYVECDDAEIYVVKFKENPQGLRVLINEYVCAEIATILELPIPSPVIVKVSDQFANDYEKELYAHIKQKVRAGTHFGSRKIKKVYPITNANMLESARNKIIIPEIILFDQLVCNRDRDSNGGNLLFDYSNMEIVVIDHTHTFDLGTIWTSSDLSQRIGQSFEPFDVSGYVYNKLVPFVSGNNPFNSALHKMQRLNDDNLWHIIDSVPKEWGILDGEKDALQRYLLDRLRRIEQVLPILKPLFPYWKGGMHND